MSKKSGGINIVGPLIFVLALVIYAFSQGFCVGLNLLGDIINIFGTVFVWGFKLIFSIPQVAEEIIKRVVTTLLILGLSTWWCVDDGLEQKIVNIIAKGIVAILFTVLSWIGMF